MRQLKFQVQYAPCDLRLPDSVMMYKTCISLLLRKASAVEECDATEASHIFNSRVHKKYLFDFVKGNEC